MYNPANAAACGRCGLPISQAGGGWVPQPQYAAPPASSSGSKSTIIVVIVVVVFVGIAFVGIVAAIAIPSLIRARAAANQSAAIGTLRSIGSAEASFQSRSNRYGTLAELANAGLIDSSISNGSMRYSYRFREVKVTATEFEFSAEPDSERVTAGDDSYNITEDFTIREAEGLKAPQGKKGRPLG